MQKKLLPVSLLFLSSIAIAQPTITNSSNPVHGCHYTYYRCDSVGPGNGGANITWNFTSLNSTSNMSMTYRNCPGWAECDTFAGSNMTQAPDTTNGGYYKITPTKFAWNGEHPTMGPRFKYTDERDTRRYPFTMGNSYTDSHKSTFISGAYMYTRTGTLTNTADAYGTLQLPTGNHTNVLRMHYTDIMHDSCHGPSLLDMDYIRDVYEWWAPGQQEYLLHVELLHILPSLFNPDTTSIATIIYTNQFPAGTENVEVGRSIKIYPVPAYDQLHVELGVEHASSVELVDIVGKKIVDIRCAEGQSEYLLETANIPAGIYLIRVNTDKGIVTKKVEIL